MKAPAGTLSLESRIKAQAYGLGFDLAGITSLGPAETAPRYEQWLNSGYAGDMHYMEKWRVQRANTRLPYPGVQSAIVVALNYGGTQPSGPIARYARGLDYHDIIRGKLRELREWLSSETGRDVSARAYVDTGPVLERDLARRAGLGWFGKNTNLLNPQLGSFFFLGSLFVDLELQNDNPFESDHCGSCTRCIDACPTGAIVDAGVLDATRCISYLTIESREAMPLELRPLVGELVYGCDICQDVCPWNVKFSREPTEPAFAPIAALAGKDARSLAVELLAMSPPEFPAAFKGSPMKRAGLRGLKRNAAVVLGNVGSAEDVPALVAALADPEPLAREHAAWALSQIGSAATAVDRLRQRLAEEPDPQVRAALESAIRTLESAIRALDE